MTKVTYKIKHLIGVMAPELRVHDCRMQAGQQGQLKAHILNHKQVLLKLKPALWPISSNKATSNPLRQARPTRNQAFKHMSPWRPLSVKSLPP